MEKMDHIFEIIEKERERQQNNIELIASENFASENVRRATGSVLTNKYAEGYIAKRYYEGCEFIDEIEEEAISRAKKLFDCEYVNVQPHSGSQANQAVFLGLLNPGDKILGMSLASGGHLTHGAKPNLSGKWFDAISYGVREDTGLIDYDQILDIAIKNKPKLIIAGYSSYPRYLDFKIFRDIANKVGAYLLADIAHIAGIISAGFHQSPVLYADIVTTTTHKTLRGPRGGMILTNNHDIAKKIDSAIFPGLQGGPLMHVIAAKAVAFGEALAPSFKIYIEKVLENAKVLAKTLEKRNFDIVTHGTDNHIVLVNLTNKNVTGKDASHMLDLAGITCNKNAVPFDKLSPFITSGIRLGTPACTTRGFGTKEFTTIGNWIADIIDCTSSVSKSMIKEMCKDFPIK